MSSSPGASLLVALATYNERDNLAPLVREIHAHLPRADILVIDDGSPDGTGQLADALADADPRIRVLHRPGKLGLGTAVLAAMHHAIDHGYDLLVSMDADFSHHPRYLPNLLAGMRDHDVMIGSRYIPQGGTAGWPVARRLMSLGVNALCRLLLRIPARDLSGGYRCYRVSRLGAGTLDQVYSHGYSFQEEVLFRCWQAGCRLGETPILFENRRRGSSKVDPLEVIRSLAVLLWLGGCSVLGLDSLDRVRVDEAAPTVS